MKYFMLIILAAFIVGCNQITKESNPNTPDKNQAVPVEANGGIGDGGEINDSFTSKYIKSIENYHKKDAFLKHKAISFKTSILFGGNVHLEGKITMLTDGSKIRIDKKDESKIIYTGENVFLCPKDASDKGARFDIFTWTYFFGMPYKLDDPGTKWELGNNMALDGTDHQTAKLTFEPGTGDAPDDWYVVYTDNKDNSLQAAAYIVTFGSGEDTSKAEEDPHAIRYRDYKIVEGIPFATKWEFYGWSNDKGMNDTLIGEATITDITFLDKEESIFEKPDNAKEIKL